MGISSQIVRSEAEWEQSIFIYNSLSIPGLEVPIFWLALALTPKVII